MSEREIGIVKLTGDNYVPWKWQIFNILKSRKLSEVLVNDKVESEVDGKTMALLGSSLSEENILKIVNCETFYAAWKSIEACF